MIGGTSKGPIEWMCRNGVAANLLMLIFLLGGFFVSFHVRQELFPETVLQDVDINVSYPASSPEEVEQGIVLAIEDEVRSLDGVKKVDSFSEEGQGRVVVEIMRGVNPYKVLQDVKNVVDGILSFPEEAERPRVFLRESQSHVISLLLYGDQEVSLLRQLAENVRESLVQIAGISSVELEESPSLEIHIEVSQENLRRYNLTLEQVAKVVNETALELPGGGVKAKGGEILLRTKERRDFAKEFLNIPIIVDPDGSQRYLGEIATVLEGTEENQGKTFFNGKPAVRINVFRVGDQKPLEITEKVRDLVATLNLELPKGISIETWFDNSEVFRERMQLLVKNGILGLLLVITILGLFLEPRLALWVAFGIPTSIIGSFLFIPLTEASINMISLFAFILTIGIIVDDAVVVGENVYKKLEAGKNSLEAAITGTKEMFFPVSFAVLTNIVAFIPLFFIPGAGGNLLLQVPSIVVVVFVVSFIESFFVLPYHLSYKKRNRAVWRLLSVPSIWFEKKLKRHIESFYKPLLKQALRRHYLTLVIGIGIMIISLGLVLGDVVLFSFFPRVDSDLITVRAEVPFGTPIKEADRVQNLLVEGAQNVLNELGGEKISRGIYSQIGGGSHHNVTVQLLLAPSEQRQIEGKDFAAKWREVVGEISGVDSLSFSAIYEEVLGASGINIELSHPEREIIEQAVEEMVATLKSYKGIHDIDSEVSLAKTQLNFTLKPEGRILGFTSDDLARQLRASFYGVQAVRQQRGNDEIKVLVRLPEKERKQIHTVEGLILQTPEGGEVSLGETVEVVPGHAYNVIKRVNGRQVVSVFADVDEEIANTNVIIADIEKEMLPNLVSKYPGLSYQIGGAKREEQEIINSIAIGMTLALLAIYALLAISFGSFLQPFIVMFSIPFGIIGAIGGHLLLGYDISIISLAGIIALGGVVINDSLVLVITANRKRKQSNCSVLRGIFFAGVNRFRPIVLTSLTTFFGLVPMIFETSPQARFLVPMAISLGFGLLFATFIILLLVPALYLIIEDLKGRKYDV